MDHWLKNSPTYSMSFKDVVDLIRDDEIIELGVDDGPVLNFDAPNE